MSTNWWAGDHWAMTWPNCLRKLVIIMISDHSTSSVLFVFMKYLNILNWCAYRREFISSEGQYLKSTNQIVPFQILDRALFPKGPFAVISDGFHLVLFWGLLDFLKKKNAYPHETVFWFLFLFHIFFLHFCCSFFFERELTTSLTLGMHVEIDGDSPVSDRLIFLQKFLVLNLTLNKFAWNRTWRISVVGPFFVFSGILKSSICFQMLFGN